MTARRWSPFGPLVAAVERRFDAAKARLGRMVLDPGAPRIVPYLGWGTAETVEVLGRVLADPPPRPSVDRESLLANLAATWQRFESDEVPGVDVEARLQGARAVGASDGEGYFRMELAATGSPFAVGWGAARLRLVGPPASPQVEARVLVPSPAAGMGVISDLDDTVIHTDAASLWRMARNVLLGSARSRLPFAGVATFYRALVAARGGVPEAPLFYVSSSPWNLFDLLVEFLERQRIPLGPLFLRDWGITETELLPTHHGSHKLGVIRRLFATYPRLPFLLVGDSGQEDPEIYRRIVEEFPGRVPAVYIRNVSAADLERPRAIAALAGEVAAHGSELLLVDTTLDAARHAASRGWIDDRALDAVRADVDRDLAPPEAPDGEDVVDESRDRPHG